MEEFLFGMIGAHPIEWLAVACGLANVGLIVRRSIWNYPFGFLMVALYFFIFWGYQLYSDALLQIYYFLIQFYGLWYWLRGRAPDGRVVVEPLPFRHLLAYLAATVAAWACIAIFMARYTDAAYPFWDAAVASLSVTAQLLLSRRHQESWIFWVLVDLLAIGLFLTRGLAPTAALYGVFLGLAMLGWLRWRQAPHGVSDR